MTPAERADVGDWVERGECDAWDVGMVVGRDAFMRRVLVEWWLSDLDWAPWAEVRVFDRSPPAAPGDARG